MAYLTFEQLCRVASPTQARELLTDILVSLRFPARSWQEGSIQRSMLETYAYAHAAQTQVVADMAKSGFNDTAEGAWLDMLSLSEYRHVRKDGVRTRGYLRLIAASSAPGPFTLQALDLVVADATGRTYRNVTGFTLAAGQALDLLVEAETAGAAGDVAVNALTELKTPLAGVSVSNPAIAGDTTWITVNGADAESDPALRQRNASRWGTLGAVAMPARGYEYYALKSDDTVRRVAITANNPRGPGTINLYVAGDAGPLSAAVVAKVNAYLSGTGPDGIDKRAAGADVLAFSAVPVSVPLKATIYLLSPYNTLATRQTIEGAILAYFRDLPVGGRKAVPNTQGTVSFGELYRAILTVPGVRNAAFVTPLADVPLAGSAVATPALDFTYLSI